MDYSSTLSNNAIIIVIVVVLIIIVIIVLIAIFSDNNNNNNNNGALTSVRVDKPPNNSETKENSDDEFKNKADKIDNHEFKEMLDKILINQERQMEVISGILNTSKDISTNKTKDNSNESDDDEDIRSSGHRVNEVYHHKNVTLESSEVEKLDLPSEEQKNSPSSVDFIHESFSDTTEFFEGESHDEPSIIKKDINLLAFNDYKNQKIAAKDKSPEKKQNIPLPKSANIDHILNSDLSSPDDETITRVNKKIPLPKAYQKK